MRILNHDYAGHAFQVELSRALARRGHEVIHVYNASDTTPKGPLVPRADDSPNLTITGLSLSETVAKGSLVKRWKQERAYAKLAVECLNKVKPDVVLSGNTPLDPQAALQRGSGPIGAKFVYWLQDLTGIATNQILSKKLPIVGPAVGAHYEMLERQLLQASAGIIPISADFLTVLDGMSIPRERVTVIENWAPLEDITPAAKRNEWSVRNDLADKFVFLYSGAMGMKHNPELLIELAKAFSGDFGVRVVVISQGIGADWLKERQAAELLTNLVLLPYQPYNELSLTLSSADVLVALLEPSAGTFSVPSKILSYHCAGKPMLVAVPLENLAARTIQKAESGLVVKPDDKEAWIAAAKKLRTEDETRRRFGENARRTAETLFAIEPITDRFEQFLTHVAEKK